MTRLTEFAPAKVNLTLAVTGRRDDGYHLLDSLVVFAGVGDTIHAEPAETLSLQIVGRYAGALAPDDDNLVLKAARALARYAGTKPAARLILEKQLPVASGIGGGSADAAATLRLLARLWSFTGDPTAVACQLGADVPVCLATTAARMTGIGDRLAAVPPLPECGLLLINPNRAVATAAVFQRRAGAFSVARPLATDWPTLAALRRDLAAAGNDLQAPAIELCPDITAVLDSIEALPNHRLARMSGSGATCFGLFDTPTDAVAAAQSLAGRGWWCWGGALHPGSALAVEGAATYGNAADWGVAKR